MLKKIPGNVEDVFKKCWGRFQGMLKKIPGNFRKYCWEYLKRLDAL